MSLNYQKKQEMKCCFVSDMAFQLQNWLYFSNMDYWEMPVTGSQISPTTAWPSCQLMLAMMFGWETAEGIAGPETSKLFH